MDNLCGTPLDAGIRKLLGTVPDWCTILSPNAAGLCEVGFVRGVSSRGHVDGLDSLHSGMQSASTPPVAVDCTNPAMAHAPGPVLAHVPTDLLLLQVPLTTTTVNGLPSYLATIADITPAISQVVGNPGHPELRTFVAQRIASPAQLQVAFTPNAGGDGNHAISWSLTPGAPSCHVPEFTRISGSSLSIVTSLGMQPTCYAHLVPTETVSPDTGAVLPFAGSTGRKLLAVGRTGYYHPTCYC